jgi:hypothetical protein
MDLALETVDPGARRIPTPALTVDLCPRTNNLVC